MKDKVIKFLKEESKCCFWVFIWFSLAFLLAALYLGGLLGMFLLEFITMFIVVDVVIYLLAFITKYISKLRKKYQVNKAAIELFDKWLQGEIVFKFHSEEDVTQFLRYVLNNVEAAKWNDDTAVLPHRHDIVLDGSTVCIEARISGKVVVLSSCYTDFYEHECSTIVGYEVFKPLIK